MKWTPLVYSLLLLILFSCSHHEKHTPVQDSDHEPKGTLFIIGGGDRDDSLMQEMIGVSGWKKGDLITAITLCSVYDSAYHWINDQLQRMSGQACVRFDSAAIHDEKKLDSLSRSKIIFIGGGDQSRIMSLIEGSEVKKIIQEAYRRGATVGGTSAGAAIMSEKMITGNQLRDTAYQSTFPVLADSNLELKEGLGLLDSVIVDMHFIARSRYNRLLSAVMENPRYQCIGIDESTAIIVHNHRARVAGYSAVAVIQDPHDRHTGTNHLLGARGIHLSIYLPGESFPVKR